MFKKNNREYQGPVQEESHYPSLPLSKSFQMNHIYLFLSETFRVSSLALFIGLSENPLQEILQTWKIWQK